MIDDKIIEKPKQSLSFVEQLQNQIQLCREASSNPQTPLTPRVETLEGLLWAKLKDDKEYNEAVKKLNEQFKEKVKYLQDSDYMTSDVKKKIGYKRTKAQQQFRAIMIFIDKKGFMPIE